MAFKEIYDQIKKYPDSVDFHIKLIESAWKEKKISPKEKLELSSMLKPGFATENENIKRLRGGYITNWIGGPPKWVKDLRIEIFVAPLVNAQAARAAIIGISEMLSDIGLKNKAKLVEINFNWNPKDVRYHEIRQLILNSLDNPSRYDISRTIDAEKFGNSVKNRRCATVLLIDRLIKGQEYGDWGRSEYDKEYVILALTRERQNYLNLDYIRRVAKHETGHLLGFPTHHINVANLFKEGYYGDCTSIDCNGNASCATDLVCIMCKDLIHAVWVYWGKCTGINYL